MTSDIGLTPEQLRSIPALRDLSDGQLGQFCGLFQHIDVTEGDVLFEPGDPPEAIYLLAAGEIRLLQEHDETFELRPPTMIGEVGAVTGLSPRNSRAVVGSGVELYRVASGAMRAFLAQSADVAGVLYPNMLAIATDKACRDQTRLVDMRNNLIRTQKTMKRMRDFLLESQDTVVSKPLHEMLEGLIKQNRRVNYRVEPPPMLVASLGMDDKSESPVLQISRTHIRFRKDEGALPEASGHISGVLRLSGPELPFSGKVLRTIDRMVDLQLDLLLDEYAAVLEGYLTRVQMTDLLI